MALRFRTSYDEQTKRILPASKAIASDTDFYRMDETKPDTANDGMKYGYKSLGQFSSVRNRKSSATLNLLGFQSTGTNLNLRYPLNTLLMDSILIFVITSILVNLKNMVLISLTQMFPI
jgi:uncharacterized membrane protein YfhO